MKGKIDAKDSRELSTIHGQWSVKVLYIHFTGTMSKGSSFLLVHNLKYGINFMREFRNTNATLIREESLVPSQTHGKHRAIEKKLRTWDRRKQRIRAVLRPDVV